VGLALLFAVLAGYDSDLIAGIALTGFGLILANAAISLSLPLQAELRLGAATAADVARQAAITAGIVILAAAGASFVALFVPHVIGGAVGLLVTYLLVRRQAPAGPRVEWDKVRRLAREAAPVAASLVLNVLYFRLLVVLMSLLSDEHETGLFGASFRVMEAVVALPVLMVGAAFPILAHAGAADSARLAYALQRLVEVALLGGTFIALVLAIAARPVVVLLGGDEFEGAAGVLQIQCVALIAAFLTQVWGFGLVALRRQQALIVINAVAVVTVVVLGLALIPPMGAEGAAIAAVAGETALAATALILLVRARPELRPHIGHVPRVLAAAAAGAAVGFLLPGLGAIPAAILAAAVFIGVAWWLNAIPAELAELLRRGQPSSSS
jgi:O-antigen/teichoic acid export membrane protein